jgi:hypothetical protein
MVGMVIGDEKIVGGPKTIRFNIRVGQGSSSVSQALFRYIEKNRATFPGNPAIFLRPVAFRPRLAAGLAFY